MTFYDWINYINLSPFDKWAYPTKYIINPINPKESSFDKWAYPTKYIINPINPKESSFDKWVYSASNPEK